MMKNKSGIPQRDLELISAYIDGQLNDRQTRALELRLQQEPGLKQELTELRVTVKQLQDSPVPRPTRHFLLTPEMVGQREMPRSFPRLRFATALAGLAFVALVGLEGLLSVSGSQLASRAPAVMQQAEQAQDAVTAAEEPLAAAPVEEQQPEMEALEMPVEQEAEEAPEAMMMEAPAEPEESAAAEDQVQKVTGTPAPTSELGLAEGRATGAGELDAADELSEEPTATARATRESPSTFYAEQEESPQYPVLSPLRWLQVISGALFIFLSVLTVTMRKRST